MRMALFLILNALLFVRPEDLWPDISGLRLYMVTITLCILVNADRLAFALSGPSLSRRPVDVCVLGMWLACGLSHLIRMQIDDALEWWSEFGKVAVYYFLLTVTLDTRERLRAFLGYSVILTALAIAAPLLNFHEITHFEAIEITSQTYNDPVTKLSVTVSRLAGLGIYSDPNDICLLLVFGGMCCLYRSADSHSWFIAVLWLLPLILFGHAFMLTLSRGGMLGLLAGLAAAFAMRFGLMRAAPMIVLMSTVLLLGIGGRQSDIGTGDTAHERIMLWATGIGVWLGNPFFWLLGIGPNNYMDYAPQVAHNSFVHAYVEVGLLGGGMFFAAFYFAAVGLWRVGRNTRLAPPTPFSRALPFVFGMLAGYAGGAYSLSRCYVLPTYLALGIAQTYLILAEPNPPPDGRVDRTWPKRFLLIAVGGAVLVKFGTQILGTING